MMYECKLWPILDLSLYLFCLLFPFFASIGFTYSNISFFLSTSHSKYRLNSWSGRVMWVCYVCCHSCSTDLTMMFLWFFLVKKWKQRRKKSELRVPFTHNMNISLSCWFVIFLSRMFVVVLLLLLLLWLLLLFVSFGALRSIGTDRIVCINVWLFGWYWLWACANAF